MAGQNEGGSKEEPIASALVGKMRPEQIANSVYGTSYFFPRSMGYTDEQITAMGKDGLNQLVLSVVEGKVSTIDGITCESVGTGGKCNDCNGFRHDCRCYDSKIAA